MVADNDRKSVLVHDIHPVLERQPCVSGFDLSQKSKVEQTRIVGSPGNIVLFVVSIHVNRWVNIKDKDWTSHK